MARIAHDFASDRMLVDIHGQMLSVPYTSGGLRALRELLMAQAPGLQRIATPAMPVQEQLNKMIRQFYAKRTAALIPKLSEEIDL